MTPERKFEITKLKSLTSEISSVQCDFYAEACIVALHKSGHKSGKALTVQGDFNESCILLWDSIPSLDGWEDISDVAEYGSLAIAFYLVNTLSEFTIVRQSNRGTGFDYWLGYAKEDPRFDADNFFVARLEISGIFKGTDADMKRRVDLKVNQTKKSAALNLPAYISVTVFSTCKSNLSTLRND